MIDAVLGASLDPMKSGVARFNQQLAERLNVPFEQIGKHPFACPLFSLKTTEWSQWEYEAVWYRRFELFLHNRPGGGEHFDGTVFKAAQRVYAGNAHIAQALARVRPDVITGFCPATIEGNADRGDYRVLTFGMVHKVAVQQFTQLKARLDLEHPNYTIALSVAPHEDVDWDENLRKSETALRSIFGHRLRVLGYLADDALARELHECDAVALFFDPAVRANNTTVWAALATGKTLYTNTDEFSPPLDVSQHTWDKLLERMGVGVSV